MKCLLVLRKAMLIICILIVFVAGSVFADDLDEIERCIVTINPRSDGSLDVHYIIDWRVLGDKPLTSLAITVANKYVGEFLPISSNVEKIWYQPEGGALIRLALDYEDQEDDLINIEFSYNQSRMYVLDDEVCKYTFVPAWFGEMAVNDMQVFWKKEEVLSSNCHIQDDDYIVWQYNGLKSGDRVSAYAEYDVNTFTTSDDMQFSDDYTPNSQHMLRFILVIFAVCCWFYDVYNGDNRRGRIRTTRSSSFRGGGRR